MAYVSQITLPNNTTYDLRDRRISQNDIDTWNSSSSGAFSYHTIVGDGTTSNFTILHNLSSKNIIVSVKITDENDNEYIAPLSYLTSIDMIGYNVKILNNNSIYISFTDAPITNGAEINILSVLATTIETDEVLIKA